MGIANHLVIWLRQVPSFFFPIFQWISFIGAGVLLYDLDGASPESQTISHLLFSVGKKKERLKAQKVKGRVF